MIFLNALEFGEFSCIFENFEIQFQKHKKTFFCENLM